MKASRVFISSEYTHGAGEREASASIEVDDDGKIISVSVVVRDNIWDEPTDHYQWYGYPVKGDK